MKIKEFIGGLLIGGIVMGLGFLSVKQLGLTQRLIPHKHDNLIFLSSLPLALYIALTMHELGHLTAAWLLRFKIYLFVSGPFGFRRNSNNRLGFFFNKNIAFAGGIVSAVPVKDEQNNYMKYAGLIIAGPVISLLWSGVSFVIFLKTRSILDIFLGYSGFLSFAIFLATTIPGTTGGMYTDRSRFFRLIKKGPEREIEKALLSCVAILQMGNSFRDLDIEKIKTIQTDKNPVISALGFFYAYHYFKDRGDRDNMQEQQHHYIKITNDLPAYLRRPLEE